jgi:hypothetical protein
MSSDDKPRTWQVQYWHYEDESEQYSNCDIVVQTITMQQIENETAAVDVVVVSNVVLVSVMVAVHVDDGNYYCQQGENEYAYDDDLGDLLLQKARNVCCY